MSQFVLFFRIDILTKEVQPSPEQMQMYMNDWNEWVEGIAAVDKLVGGNHLSPIGKVINSKKTVTDEPFAETKVSVAGYIIIMAANIDEAVEIAKDCPILGGEGNSVEVREVGG